MQKIAKNSPSAHHRTTLSDYIFATKAHIDNRKNLLNNDISPTCPYKQTDTTKIMVTWPCTNITHTNFQQINVGTFESDIQSVNTAPWVASESNAFRGDEGCASFSDPVYTTQPGLQPVVSCKRGFIIHISRVSDVFREIGRLLWKTCTYVKFREARDGARLFSFVKVFGLSPIRFCTDCMPRFSAHGEYLLTSYMHSRRLRVVTDEWWQWRIFFTPYLRRLF